MYMPRGVSLTLSTSRTLTKQEQIKSPMQLWLESHYSSCIGCVHDTAKEFWNFDNKNTLIQ